MEESNGSACKIYSEETMDDSKKVVSRTGGRSYTVHHVIVFWLTLLSYTFYHASRKTFSFSKASMIETWLPTNLSNSTMNRDYDTWNSHQFFSTRPAAEQFAGTLDAIFMFTHSVTLVIMGMLGDRKDPRLIVSFGMILGAVFAIIFGPVLEWYNFYSIPLYIVLWILYGICQSTGWPTMVGVMGNWFGRKNRGLIMGIWTSSAPLGNIIAAYLCAAVLPYGYEYAFLVTSSLWFAGGIIVFFGLLPSPTLIGLEEPTDDAPDQLPVSLPGKEKQKAITCLGALLIPGVVLYSLVYSAISLVNYAIFFWLPYYLNGHFNWSPSVADEESTYYDWFGVVGSITSGLVSDALGKRSPVLFTQLVLSILFLGLYTQAPDDQISNGIMMGMVGFFISGAVTLIASTAASDLGRRETLRRKAGALSTVSGLVDGTGICAAAIGQVVIPILEGKFGWNSIFYLFMIFLAIASLAVARLAYQDTKAIFRDFKDQIVRLSSGIGVQEQFTECRYEVPVIDNVQNDETGQDYFVRL